MKKTLLITSNFFPAEGGIGSHMGIYFYLPGKSAVVLAPKEGDYQEFDRNSSLKIVRSRWFGNYSGLGRILRICGLTLAVLMILKMHQIQVVHIADIKAIPLPLWYIFKFVGLPVVSFIHGQELAILGPQKIRAALASSKLIIAISGFTRDTLISDFKVPSGKIAVLNPGFKQELLKVETQPQKIRTKYKLQKKFVILTISRLIKRKGHATVLNSLAHLKQAGYGNFSYLIVGRGPEEATLKDLIRDLNLEDTVNFVGYTPDEDLPSFYDACDVFVMVPVNIAGDYEGFGIVYLEAGAFGKPVIGSRSGGIPDAIKDGKTGFLINPEDHQQLAEILLRLAKNKDLGIKLGRNGYNLAKRSASDKIAERLLSIIERNGL